ncbi:MAG: OmpA family protein [Bacteroidales bacterium]|nr:OmpA family protein [Bacteroidales bacterium]
MNKKSVLSAAMVAALMMAGTGSADAQFFKKLKEKVKNKVEQKIDNMVDRAVNGAVDGAVDGAGDGVTGAVKGKKSSGDGYDAAEVEEADAVNNVGNVKNDFVRGSVVVFEDAVSGEQVGEFPSKWDLERGNAEIAVVNGKQVIEFAKDDSWIKPLISKNPLNYFGDEFTVEFDLLYTEGGFEIDFMHPESQRDLEIFTLHWYDAAGLDLNYVKGGEESNYDKGGNSACEQKTKLNNGRWHHYAISFNKRVIKVYVDGVRYINAPNAKAGAGWMTFFFRGDKPAYLKNVVIARGAGELYQRNATDLSEGAIEKAIAETGKFVTNNILFETGKADLKAESMEEIKKVAAYMKKNPSARFEVQGHTDSQGTDKTNDALSQKRAEAVVAALASLGVDDFNLKPVGKGSRVPVADNSTADGRAQNRRVEFIKR